MDCIILVGYNYMFSKMAPKGMLWGPSNRADRVIRPYKEFRRGRRPRPVLPHYHAIRRGGVLPRPREGQSPSPTHTTWNRPHRADRAVRPCKEFRRCRCLHRPAYRSPCNVSLRGRSAPVAIRPPHALAGTLRPYSKITAPLFFSASPLRISASVSSNPSLVCSPVAMSLQATTPAAISSSPKKITYGTPILSA